MVISIDFANILRIVGAWLAVASTLAIFSFLYKDNPVFKLAEHIFVGISLGYGLTVACYEVYWKMVISPLYELGKHYLGRPAELTEFSTPLLLIPITLGLLMITLYIPKISWLARYTMAFIYGWGSGIAIPMQASQLIFKQLRPTLQPVYIPSASWWKAIQWDVIIVLIGVISVLVYFFYSIEHKGGIRAIAKVGIYFLMVSFGASFGYTVMARESLLIGRFQDLVRFSGPQYGFASIILAAIFITIIIIAERKNSSKKT